MSTTPMTFPALQRRPLNAPPPVGEHAVWHRLAGCRKWVLHGVYPSRWAAWDVPFGLRSGDIRVAPAGSDPVAAVAQIRGTT